MIIRKTHKQYLYSNLFNLAYFTIGTAKSTVLCIHGITRNSKDFNLLAMELEKNHTVICVDVFGRGDSEWLLNKQHYNYKLYYNSIIKLIQFLNIKKISLIGTSMGGIIAMYIAAYSGIVIEKVILNDIGPHIPLTSLQKLATYIKKFPKFENKAEAMNYLRVLLSPLRLKNDEQLLHMVENSLTLKKDKKYYLNYDPMIGEKFYEDIKNMNSDMDLWHVWEKISQPVLILRGGQSKVLTSITANQMTNTKDNVQLIEYPEIGHPPSLIEQNHISDISKWLNIKY